MGEIPEDLVTHEGDWTIIGKPAREYDDDDDDLEFDDDSSLYTSDGAPYDDAPTRLRRPPQRDANVGSGDAARASAVSPSAVRFDPQQFGAGDLVRHQKFGVGRIADISGAGRNRKATVNFRANGVKVLVLEFARLERIDL